MDEIRELFRIADEETNQGNFRKAIESYERALEISAPESSARHIAHWGIGDIYLNNRDYDKAEYHLKQAIRLKKDESTYHYLLGCTYTYTNEVAKAIRHLEKAISLDGTQDIYWGQLGWVVGYNRDTDKGIEYLKKSLSINPGSMKLLKDICILYAKKHKYGEALVCIEEALKQEPDNTDLQSIKSDVEFFRSEYERLTREETEK